MYSLTEKRLASAEAILENYRAQLFAQRPFDAQSFERELRDLWQTGYQEMNSVALQLLKNERYREVAVYYMEHSNPGTGVAAEFKLPLASVYGVKTFDAPEREEMQKRYWANVFESAGA
ncbi:MAG: hypothetical protein KAV82_12515 [Phycisphaerae bacterium]|nr:hypothetical protein [Phycisphaerae bacterium]